MASRMLGILTAAACLPGVLRFVESLWTIWERWDEIPAGAGFFFSWWHEAILTGVLNIVFLALGVLLWARSVAVARWVRGDGEGMQWVSRCVLGIGLLILIAQIGTLVPMLLRQFAIYRQYQSFAGLYVGPNPLLRLSLMFAATFAGAAIGMFLIFKRHTVARYALQGLGLACPKCSYPLVGLESATACPECGESLVRESRART